MLKLPVIVLFHQHGTDQPSNAVFIGADAHDIRAALDCLVAAFDGVCAVQRDAMRFGILHVGQNIVLGGIEQRRHIRADYLVRTGWRSLALRDLEGEPFDLFAHLARLQPGDRGDFPVQVVVSKRLLPTRLVVLAQDEDAVTRALRRVRRKAQKNC